jgi:microcompartment protein CcmK/EutM
MPSIAGDAAGAGLDERIFMAQVSVAWRERPVKAAPSGMKMA